MGQAVHQGSVQMTRRRKATGPTGRKTTGATGTWIKGRGGEKDSENRKTREPGEEENLGTNRDRSRGRHQRKSHRRRTIINGTGRPREIHSITELMDNGETKGRGGTKGKHSPNSGRDGWIHEINDMDGNMGEENDGKIGAGVIPTQIGISRRDRRCQSKIREQMLAKGRQKADIQELPQPADKMKHGGHSRAINLGQVSGDQKRAGATPEIQGRTRRKIGDGSSNKITMTEIVVQRRKKRRT